MVMVFHGSEGITTRVVWGYNPCKTGKKSRHLTYQQHQRYLIQTEKDTTCPRKCFQNDLLRQLIRWRKVSDRLIVCMDVNSHIYKKSIGKALAAEAGLEMKEVVGDFTDERIGATFF